MEALLAEREDFGDRILTQRLVVFRRWFKGFSAERLDAAIRDANREALYSRLSSTVNLSLEAAEPECMGADGQPAPCPTEEAGEGGAAPDETAQ